MAERTQIYLKDGNTAALEYISRQLGLTVHRGRNTGQGNVSHFNQLMAALADDRETIEFLEQKKKEIGFSA